MNILRPESHIWLTPDCGLDSKPTNHRWKQSGRTKKAVRLLSRVYAGV